MAEINIAANFERTGVVAGFVLAVGAGLTPTITRGALYAQGQLYRPPSAPGLPQAPANAQSWLFYSASAGFYWAAAPTPVAVDDAFLGWARTSSTAVTLVSSQRLAVPDRAERVIGGGSIGVVLPQGPGTQGGAGDSGLPAKPDSMGIDSLHDGRLILGPIVYNVLVGQPPPANIAGIESATFAIYYCDELTPVTTTLNGAVDAVTLQFVVNDASGLNVGDEFVGDQEICLITAKVGNTLTVNRTNRHGTIPAAHGNGARLDLVKLRIFSYEQQPGIFLNPDAVTPNADNWRAIEHVPDVRVIALEGTVRNSFGDSAVFQTLLIGGYYDIAATGDLTGLRSNRGGAAAQFYVPGTMLDEDPGLTEVVDMPTAIRHIQFKKGTAPVGGSVDVETYKNGVLLAVVTFAASQTTSSAYSGATLGPLARGDKISIKQKLAGGVTDPGSELSGGVFI